MKTDAMKRAAARLKETKAPDWIEIGFATKNGNEYIILQAGKRNKLYNIVKKGDPMPTGGYYELKSIMRLKGINGFQSGGAR